MDSELYQLKVTLQRIAATNLAPSGPLCHGTHQALAACFFMAFKNISSVQMPRPVNAGSPGRLTSTRT